MTQSLNPERSDLKDSSGLTALERFDQIANFYLALLKTSGSPHPPGILYDRKKFTSEGYYSEKDLIDRWAKQLDAPLRHILQGITRGFNYTKKNGEFVRSFSFLLCHITQRVREGTPL